MHAPYGCVDGKYPMTARVTTLKGTAAGEYYVHELPNYYLDSGEPKGLWLGQGAEHLGLTGVVNDDQFLNLMAGVYPDRPELLLGTRYTDESVRGFDVTASAPKSVSILMAIGDDKTRAAVLESHDIAVATMASWIEHQATTRFRVNGSEPQTFDAEGLVMATFRQHTSRALDPQLHTHLVISNKVKSPDGRWLALDARQLKKHQRTASAHYHLTLRSELSERLGVEWQPVENGIAEMAYMPELILEEYSTRTHQIDRRLDDKVDRFVDTMGREPTPREYWKLDREAVLDSRPAKVKDVSAAELHRRWTDQASELGVDPDGLAASVAHRTVARPLDSDVATQAIDDAIGVLGESVSSWHPAELNRHIAAALPTDIHIAADQIVPTLQRMTDYALQHRCVNISRPVSEGAQLRGDGRPTTESPIDQAYTTEAILRSEGDVLAWAERRVRYDQIDSAAAPERSLVPLTKPQRQAAAAIAGDAHLTLIVGPAGTGKTTAIRPAIEQLQSEGRAVFGVAPSAAAADVLERATGVASDTVDKLLVEHSLHRAPDHRFDLPVGATLIVDEAGMLGTANLERLTQLADVRGWRVALVGDPMQFTSVGRGGMFQHLVDSHGAIELDRVHRFTNLWERAASLRLRRGDNSVADLYEDQGRLHGGTATRMKREALDAWQQARVNGETVVLSAPSKEVVRELNMLAQQRRINVGEIDRDGRTIAASGYQLHVGDEVVTRRNDRTLTTNTNQPVRNRDRWTVEVIHRNGDLTVAGATGVVRLPAHYSRDHVELGYAQTSHAIQGQTVDRSILYLDGPTDSRGVYVPMTRGKHRNDAYVVTQPGVTARDVLAESISRDAVDRPAHARRAELQGINDRPGTIDPGHLRQLIDRLAKLETAISDHSHAIRSLPRQIEEADEKLVDLQGRFVASTERIGSADAVLAKHDRPLRRKGHEIAIGNAQQILASEPGAQERLRREIKQVSRRKDTLTSELEIKHQRTHRVPTLKAEVVDLAKQLDDDRHIRSRIVRRDAPERVVDVLGERPPGGEPSRAWDRAAGQLDQHQAAFGVDDGSAGRSDGFAHSFDRVTSMGRELERTVTQERQQANRGMERPSLGIEW